MSVPGGIRAKFERAGRQSVSRQARARPAATSAPKARPTRAFTASSGEMQKLFAGGMNGHFYWREEEREQINVCVKKKKKFSNVNWRCRQRKSLYSTFFSFFFIDTPGSKEVGLLCLSFSLKVFAPSDSGLTVPLCPGDSPLAPCARAQPLPSTSLRKQRRPRVSGRDL